MLWRPLTQNRLLPLSLGTSQHSTLKCLLPKTSHTLVTGYGEIRLELNSELLPFLAAFAVPEVLCELLKESCSHPQFCFIMVPACYTVTNQARCTHWHNSGTAVLGATNCFLVGFKAHSRLVRFKGHRQKTKIPSREVTAFVSWNGYDMPVKLPSKHLFPPLGYCSCWSYCRKAFLQSGGSYSIQWKV